MEKIEVLKKWQEFVKMVQKEGFVVFDKADKEKVETCILSKSEPIVDISFTWNDTEDYVDIIYPKEDYLEYHLLLDACQCFDTERSKVIINDTKIPICVIHENILDLKERKRMRMEQLAKGKR